MDVMKLMDRVGLVALAVLALALSSPAGATPYIAGFVEGAQAVRVEQNDALGDGEIGDRSYPRSEFRAQFTAQDDMDLASLFLRVDLVSDATDADRNAVDVREAYIKLYPATWLDVKFGRPVATWGTGDLVFANDLFAKDWDAFFTGMNDSYLKPPQDLLRLTFYAGNTTAELAAAPYFTSDNLPDGRRLSIFNPFMQQSVGAAQAPMVIRPEKNLTNGELFARVFGNTGSFEWALYGYKGFWPTPQGMLMDAGGGVPALYFPEMWSSGASLRGPVGSFLVNLEGAAYISREDEDGDNPTIPNSVVRGIVGLEKSLGNDWTVGAQYFGEQMLAYDEYEEAHKQAFGVDEVPYEELRSTATARITKFMMNQSLQLSLFGYTGLTDEDWHLRPVVTYKVTDAVTWTTGANIVGGEEPYTMFGQFRDNDNIYMRLRYSF